MPFLKNSFFYININKKNPFTADYYKIDGYICIQKKTGTLLFELGVFLKE